MPFKTKKKKQSASKNRISLSKSGFLTYKNTAELSQTHSNKISTVQGGAGVIDVAEHARMRRELVKIFLLSSVIIGLQVALKASKLSLFE